MFYLKEVELRIIIDKSHFINSLSEREIHLFKVPNYRTDLIFISFQEKHELKKQLESIQTKFRDQETVSLNKTFNIFARVVRVDYKTYNNVFYSSYIVDLVKICCKNMLFSLYFENLIIHKIWKSDLILLFHCLNYCKLAVPIIYLLLLSEYYYNYALELSKLLR